MQKKTSQERFKDYLKKIGSGEQTSRSLSREESADALELILTGIPSPAQIGGFLIAHRIRRPEPQELAGMLDTYKKLGPNFENENKKSKPICFGMPFDGRTKYAPIYPLTVLVLLSAHQPIVLHGGNRMPTKYGVSTKELFESIEINLNGINFDQLVNGFKKHNFALIHQPDHFPLAEKLIYFREELGKRPTIASMELLWSAHKGNHLLVSGYVHPPTQQRHCKTLELIGEKHFLLINGLEGGVDIALNRINSYVLMNENNISKASINSKDYQFFEKDCRFRSLEEWKSQALLALENQGPLINALIWNSAFYLYLVGKSNSINDGIKYAKYLIDSKRVLDVYYKMKSFKYNLN